MTVASNAGMETCWDDRIHEPNERIDPAVDAVVLDLPGVLAEGPGDGRVGARFGTRHERGPTTYPSGEPRVG